MQQSNVQNFQTWAKCSIEVLNNQSNVVLETPATLANAVLLLEFYNGDTPVTTGIAGTLSVAKQWLNGRIQPQVAYQLNATNVIQLTGLVSKVYLTLSNLVGCDKIVVNSAQYANQ